MKRVESLEVIGIDVATPNKFLVVTQCDGSCFDQNYPKVIRHSFRYTEKKLADVDGEPFFIRKMRKLYTSQSERIGRVDKESTRPEKGIEDAVNDLNNEWTGYTI